MEISGILEIRRGGEVSEYHLTQPITTIGRSADNQVVLGDELVSRHHARVEWAEGVPWIIDLGSANGTLVNGTTIEPKVSVPLKEGDVIGIADFTLTFRTLSPTEKPPPAERVPVSVVREEPAAPAEAAAPARGTKLPRAKVLAIVGGAVVLIGVLLVVLLPGAKEDIKVEVGECLMEMNTAAIDDIDLELDEIGQQARETEEKLLKLEQVVTPALEWVDYQKANTDQYLKNSSWIIRVPSGELDQLKNDQYQVTTLEFSVSQVKTPQEQSSAVIKVTDLTTKTVYDWEALDSELEDRKAKLEQRAQARGEKGELAISTFLEVMDCWEDWEVKNTGSNIYSVSGYGLGWADGLTKGRWTYYRDTGEIIPRDSHSEALKKVLVAES
ncbi:MAG TPA: FHA domain-containing protein [Dehalococcoidia bacterium]|nr:FHA domain-containing protein [Dehalococcoidia bacterium]